MSEDISTGYINQITFTPTNPEYDLVDIEDCIQTDPSDPDIKIITKIPSTSFLHELDTICNKCTKFNTDCIPNWWLNRDLDKYFAEMVKIDWVNIFNQTIDEGYPSIGIRYKPFTYYLENDLEDVFLKKFAYKLLSILSLDDKYREYTIDYEYTDKKLSEYNYNQLPIEKHVQIMKNYDYIIVMFDVGLEHIKKYQKIAFDYNLMYAKNVYVHKHLEISEESGITHEFINMLDNWFYLNE